MTFDDHIYFGSNGTQTSALGYGGNPNYTYTESWNGTNWTEVNDLNTAAARQAGAGADNTSALAFGGVHPTLSPSISAFTESWNGTNWTEVNDMNTGRFYLSGTGIQTSALAVGGSPAPINSSTEEWSETGGNQSVASS